MKKTYIVYKFTNTVTGDFYIGSQSIKKSLANHKYQSIWTVIPNDQMYQDMQKYGDDKFVFEILAEAEVEQLKEIEQQFIEELKPTYNNYNADDLNIERQKESNRKANKQCRESHKEQSKQYHNQLCLFNGETLTLNALSTRFSRMGIPHPTLEAKKYLLQ